MAEFNFVELVNELDIVSETGVNFSGQSQKWEKEEDVRTLIEEINNCSHLVYLNLEGNTLGTEAAKRIGQSLEQHPEFKKALWKDLFTGRLKTEIPEALKYLGEGIMKAAANLTVLDCSDNALGPNGMKGLVDLLKSPSCFSLQELKLNNCGLGIDGGKMLAGALLECCEKSKNAGTPLSLKVFIAGRNRLENEGAKALAKVFAAVKTLEEIVMPQNGIYHEGIKALSESFKVNENLKILNLNDNTITAKGATALAEAFVSMQKLREINFGDCLLKTKGALKLADALQDAHSDLEVLNLSANEIGLNGGLAIASAVQHKTRIRSVMLEANNFNREARERIREKMQQNIDALGNLSDEESGEEDEEGNDEDDDDYSEGDSTEGEEDECDEDEEYDDSYKNAHETSEEYIEDENYVSALTAKTGKENIFFDNSVTFAGTIDRPNTIETFCNTPHPTVTMFNSLEETDKNTAFKNYLETFKDDDYLIHLVFTTLKCSALSEESKEALDVAEYLYKEAFKYAQETNQITRVKNFFLIQLGLLKTEEKSFKPTYNLKACRNALKETLSRNEFPDEISTTFNLFLQKFG